MNTTKKYQIFISSTYNDLAKERDNVIKTILSLEHIPIGMEMFNAGDEEQWELIKRTIDNSDYYIVIIGFRYGSLANDGLGYTEKEYDYALEKGVPILTFIKDRTVPSREEERENEPEMMDKLKRFTEKAKNRISKFWKTSDELAAHISTSLQSEIRRVPRIGWSRIDGDYVAMAQEISELSKENRELRKKMEIIENKKPELVVEILNPNDNSTTPFEYEFVYSNYNQIEVTPLNENNLTDEIRNIVTIKELNRYNENLPTQEEIDLFNEKNILYNNSINNKINFCVSVENIGKIKANEIYIDFYFPPELLVYSDDDIENIEEPSELNFPIDPIQEALKNKKEERLKAFGLGTNSYDQMLANFKNIPVQGIYRSDFFKEKKIDPTIYISDDHSSLEIHIEHLMQTKEYWNEGLYIIALKKGKFEVKYKIICEELSEPIEKFFEVNII